MSFFKDLKADWSQAVNELLPEDELMDGLSEDGAMEDLLPDGVNPEEAFFADTAAPEISPDTPVAVKEEEELADLDKLFTLDAKDEKDTSDALESYDIALEVPQKEEKEAEDIIEKEENQEEEIEMKDTLYEDGNVEKDLLNQLLEEELEEKKTEEASTPAAEPVADSGNTTIITQGTTINGSISSDGSLEVMGTITGDIECLGKLSIVGRVSGSSTANEIYVDTPRLEGNLNSRGSVKVGVGTVVVGDIKGTSAVIAGAVKGEIDVNGAVIVDSTAIVKGNINAKSVQINNGAVLDGYCSLTYSDVDLDNFFSGDK
jgi:cytoskeletal protein CcmA (bactofilin family)